MIYCIQQNIFLKQSKISHGTCCLVFSKSEPVAIKHCFCIDHKINSFANESEICCLGLVNVPSTSKT